MKIGNPIADNALIEAAKRNDVNGIRDALNRGADVNAADGYGPAICHAAERGHVDAVEELLNNGANATIKNRHSEDALKEAAKCKKVTGSAVISIIEAHLLSSTFKEEEKEKKVVSL